MPNNNKQSNRGSVGHQREGQGQNERGDYGNTNRNASSSRRREGQPQSQETRRGGTQSNLGGKNNEDDEM